MKTPCEVNPLLLPTTIKLCAPLVATCQSELRRMVKARLVPSLRTGMKGKGVRVIPAEVLDALRNRASSR